MKSIAEPHIKWLKRLSAGAPAAADTLSVGSERYRVLDSAPNSNNVVDNLKVNSVHKTNSGGNSEYLNRLVLENVRESDAGMYICFVTNSGFGALTYKSMNLRVVKAKKTAKVNPTNDINRNINTNQEEGEPLDILIPVICLSVVVFILIVAIMVCVVKNRSKAANVNNGTLDKSSADESVVSDVQRPFVPHPAKFEVPAKGTGKYPKYSTSSGKWSHTVYPAANATSGGGGKLPCGDSGFDAAESTAMTNQYEVPFAHLAAGQQQQQLGQFGQYNGGQQFLRPAALQPQQPPPLQPYQYRAVPTGQSSAGSAYSRNLQQQQQYPYPPRHQQYLSDYESQ